MCRNSNSRLRPRFSGLGATVIAALGFAVPATAQFADRVDPDPDMPVKEGFDTERAIFWEHTNFEPLRDPELMPLRDARRAGDVDDETTIVAFEAGGRTIAIVSSQMAYHHVAQGEMAGEPWMVTF